jgi:hypothetical protein
MGKNFTLSPSSNCSVYSSSLFFVGSMYISYYRKAKETENYQAQSLDRGMEINSYTHTQYITTAQYNIIMHYTHGL